MEHPVELITSVDEVNYLIEEARLDRRRKNIEADKFDTSSVTKEARAMSIKQDIALTEADIASVIASIPPLPEGKLKRNRLMTLKGLEFKLMKLQAADENSGGIYTLEKSRDHSVVLASIAAVDEFIAQLEVRRAELES